MLTLEAATAETTVFENQEAPACLIMLSDGTQLDITRIASDELRRLQWNQERDFARRIAQSPKGSAERAEATRVGYDTICTILSQLRTNTNHSLVMGHDVRYERLVLQLFKRQASRHVTPRLFELGYGTGQLLAAISAQGYDVGGIEVSAAMRDQARRNVVPPYRDGLLLGDFLQTDLTAEAGRYSIVYWNDVFEHIPTDEILDFLRKIYTLIAPGGQLVTITPNWHTRPSDITSQFHPPRTEAVGFHLKEYTLRESTALLRQAGFAHVATPLLNLKRRMILCGSGGSSIKCVFEPLLEFLPFAMAKKLCRGFGLHCTIATKR